MLRNKKKGFTLIELVIVIAIIGILIAIAVPRFAEATRGATNRKIESQARAIAGAVTSVIADKAKVVAVGESDIAITYQGVDVVARAGLSGTEAGYYKVGVNADGSVIVVYESANEKYYGSLAYKEFAATSRYSDAEQALGQTKVYFKF